MAVNLIDSSDITVTQTGDNIQLETTVDIQTLESNVGSLSDLDTTDKSSIVNAINELCIEKGTENGWTYFKYANGVAECFKNISGTVAVTTSWGSGLYYGTVNAETFPTDLFIEVPTISLTNISGASLIAMNSGNASKTSTGNIQVTRATSNGSATYTISIIAKGFWK